MGNTTNANNSSISADTVFFPATDPGSLIICWIVYNSSTASVSSVTDGGDTFSKAVGPTVGANGLAGWSEEIWYAVTSGVNGIITANFLTQLASLAGSKR